MITKAAIMRNLINAGLSDGDHVLVHSSLSKVGPVDGGADALIDALLETVGEDGTVAMPSFCYPWGIPEPYFDAAETPGKTGVLTEIFRQRPDTVRSIDPIYSVSAHGKRAEEFLFNHLAYSSIGVGSPIDRIAKAGGYVLLIGVAQTSNSTIHVGESYANVKKFFAHEGPPPIARVLMADGAILEHEIDPSGSCGRGFNAVEYPLRRAHMIVDLDIGKARALLIKGSDIINVVRITIQETPDILFCNKSNCRRCILGRKFALEIEG